MQRPIVSIVESDHANPPTRVGPGRASGRKGGRENGADLRWREGVGEGGARDAAKTSFYRFNFSFKENSDPE